jgi:hypothetical protein
MRSPNLITGVGLLIWLVFSRVAEAAAMQPPNIIFPLAHDLGGRDLDCYGNPYSRTSNIDSLSQDGIRFEEYYATGATFCPARRFHAACMVEGCRSGSALKRRLHGTMRRVHVHCIQGSRGNTPDERSRPQSWGAQNTQL